jgi:vacuolar-type H+-ATPase subunit H
MFNNKILEQKKTEKERERRKICSLNNKNNERIKLNNKIKFTATTITE